MTKLKTIIVLDNNNMDVFITDVLCNPSDDMEVSVDDKLTALDRNIDECSWMEVSNEFTTDDIKII